MRKHFLPSDASKSHSESKGVAEMVDGPVPAAPGRHCMRRLDFSEDRCRRRLIIRRSPNTDGHYGASYGLSDRRRRDHYATKSAAAAAISEGGGEDWEDLGKEIARRTSIGDIAQEQVDVRDESDESDDDEPDGENPTDEKKKEKKNTPKSYFSIPVEDESEETAPARKMTLSEWTHRTPSRARGDADGPWPNLDAGERVVYVARCAPRDTHARGSGSPHHH